MNRQQSSDAEEQLTAVQAALQQRGGQAQQLQARMAELEAELEAARHEQRTAASGQVAKERDNMRRLEHLQEEVDSQRDQVPGWANIAPVQHQLEKCCSQWACSWLIRRPAMSSSITEMPNCAAAGDWG